MTSKKVSIITLGCAKNQNDTDNLTGLLQEKGYGVEANPEKADAIVVHTCSFIEAAKKESIQTILDAAKLKGENKKLYVTGCMVQQHGKELLTELPEVDAFLGTGQLKQIPDLLEKPRERFLDRANPGGLMDPEAKRALQKKGATATLRLSEGCSHPCSFCVIPKLRGSVQSRSEVTILKEVRDLAAQGVEELVIIGQDTGDWGREMYKNEKRLPQLLREIGKQDGIRWVRLMYMHPASFTDELIQVFADLPEKFPYLDMPLQHIDDVMLKDMNRIQGEHYVRNLIEKIHKRLPNLSLRTTFIVGYPGETDAQFEKLLDYTREGHFNHMGSFTYSQEEATPASLKPNQIPEDVKKERQAALAEAQFDVTHNKAQERMGKITTVVIDESEGEDVLGRSAWEAPEIDAVIRLPKKATRKGRFVQAKITGYDAYEYSAEII